VVVVAAVVTTVMKVVMHIPDHDVAVQRLVEHQGHTVMVVASPVDPDELRIRSSVNGRARIAVVDTAGRDETQDTTAKNQRDLPSDKRVDRHGMLSSSHSALIRSDARASSRIRT
jgi:hypothetical protein